MGPKLRNSQYLHRSTACLPTKDSSPNEGAALARTKAAWIGGQDSALRTYGRHKRKSSVSQRKIGRDSAQARELVADWWQRNRDYTLQNEKGRDLELCLPRTPDIRPVDTGRSLEEYIAREVLARKPRFWFLSSDYEWDGPRRKNIHGGR